MQCQLILSGPVSICRMRKNIQLFLFSTLARNMEEYWQSNEIWRRLIFLPSGPDATDGLAEM